MLIAMSAARASGSDGVQMVRTACLLALGSIFSVAAAHADGLDKYRIACSALELAAL